MKAKFALLSIVLSVMLNPTVLAAPPAPAGLTVEKEKDVKTTAPAEAIWDFGRRKVATGETIAHVFVLRNTTKAPVMIDSLLTSCHCTTATVLKPGSASVADLPFALAPGKSARIKVAIDVDLAHAVDFRKMVWIYVQGKDEAAFTLTVAGTMSPANED